MPPPISAAGLMVEKLQAELEAERQSVAALRQERARLLAAAAPAPPAAKAGCPKCGGGADSSGGEAAGLRSRLAVSERQCAELRAELAEARDQAATTQRDLLGSRRLSVGSCCSAMSYASRPGASPQRCSGPWPVGAPVTAHGLRNKTELNGQEGTVRGFVQRGAELCAHVDFGSRGKATMYVRNLQPVVSCQPLSAPPPRQLPLSPPLSRRGSESPKSDAGGSEAGGSPGAGEAPALPWPLRGGSISLSESSAAPPPHWGLPNCVRLACADPPQPPAPSPPPAPRSARRERRRRRRSDSLSAASSAASLPAGDTAVPADLLRSGSRSAARGGSPSPAPRHPGGLVSPPRSPAPAAAEGREQRATAAAGRCDSAELEEWVRLRGQQCAAALRGEQAARAALRLTETTERELLLWDWRRRRPAHQADRRAAAAPQIAAAAPARRPSGATGSTETELPCPFRSSEELELCISAARRPTGATDGTLPPGEEGGADRPVAPFPDAPLPAAPRARALSAGRRWRTAALAAELPPPLPPPAPFQAQQPASSDPVVAQRSPPPTPPRSNRSSSAGQRAREGSRRSASPPRGGHAADSVFADTEVFEVLQPPPSGASVRVSPPPSDAGAGGAPPPLPSCGPRVSPPRPTSWHRGPESARGELPVGAVVAVEGMRRATELNGRLGRVCGVPHGAPGWLLVDFAGVPDGVAEAAAAAHPSGARLGQPVRRLRRAHLRAVAWLPPPDAVCPLVS
eukprot:TRINITY_DN30168_c0_g1_i1.p1 TRINITY_DN30168_c0_g1~~TRINITY_DN30168_c0_g1_i1.p1  ORF type:complete len:847 (+),score=188.26 TRINITY_DN30168_c0_g1_i1:314-2542(+)